MVIQPLQFNITSTFFIYFLYFKFQNKTKQKAEGAAIQVTKPPETLNKRTQNHVTSRNRNRNTALERSALDYWGGL
ncbi:MAG: hypothetical protein AB2693_23450, partial [Candidatus Thiodiazotropha sp.]